MADGVLGMLTSDHIRCRVHAETRNDVVRLTGDLLEHAGLTEARYTQAMTEMLDELGPYIVMAPGVALPHARPDRGVRQVGMVLLTLDQPVAFGHTENDPVWLAVGLAGTDDHAHEKALGEIAFVLAMPDALEAIRRAPDAEGVLAAIRDAASQQGTVASQADAE